ncbi:hypothetical protein JXM83_01850 [Candidatus Woesearchaeota archaeon]|nr:hypothetical protein [Candidatus Woesearchaeota archaeon]
MHDYKGSVIGKAVQGKSTVSVYIRPPEKKAIEIVEYGSGVVEKIYHNRGYYDPVVVNHRCEVFKPVIEQQFFGPFRNGVNLYSIGNVSGMNIFVGDLNGKRIVFNVKSDLYGNPLYDSEKNLQIRKIKEFEPTNSLEDYVSEIFTKLDAKQKDKVNSVKTVDVHKIDYERFESGYLSRKAA